MFMKRNPGKLRIPHRKNTASMTPERMPSPSEVLLQTGQHIGAPAAPIVKVGDTVKVGQLIAEAQGPVSSPIHASVSGTVKKIEDYQRAKGNTVPAIRIESDGLMTPYEGLTPPKITDVDSLVAAFRESGIIGMGGAGFPTAVKLNALKNGNVHTVILNGAECEPYITCDTRTMIDDAQYIYEGIKLIESVAPSVERYVIGIESNKPECIRVLGEITKDDAKVSILTLPSLYPQGAETVLTYNATGIVIPENKLPGDLGVIVINVTTLAAFAKYAETGMPLVERCVTLDGGAIKEPKNVLAPIGTIISDIIEFAGGLSQTHCKVLMGGPMTGNAVLSLTEPIVKTTNAIIAMTEKDTVIKKTTACLHCGRCTEACPLSLSPEEFGCSLKVENIDERMERLKKARITLCMECGCCSYVCPAARPLMENLRLAKNTFKEYAAHKASLK